MSSFQDESTVVVIYIVGYVIVLVEVKVVVFAVVVRQYDNPQGFRQVSIDDYSETRVGADDDLAGVFLLAVERHILKRYCAIVGLVRV